MKKIIALILALCALLSLSSCKREYFYAEGTIEEYIDTELIQANGVSIAFAREIYSLYYPTDDTVIYFPRSGEFKTKTGKRFISEVNELCSLHFIEKTELSRISFHISIYDESGELIVEREAFSSYVQEGTKKLDMTYVSEEFAPYWEAIAIRSDKISFD